MPLSQVIVLAVVQGLTEFLPVSSTAHLALVPWLFGWPDPGLSFDIALHAGTLIAVLIYFAPTWIKILRAAMGAGIPISQDQRGPGEIPLDEARRERLLLWFLVAATIPAAIAGVLLRKQAESSLRAPWVMAGTMIGVGLIMAWSEKIGSLRKPLTGITLADALWVGAAQATAVVPGVSRSGSTIAAGLFRGMSRDAAARFSFLLSTPIIAGAALFEGHRLLRAGIPPEMRVAFLVGVIVSGIVGYASIALFVRYLRTHSLKIFIVYRIVFGIIILALAYFAHFQA